MIRFLICSCWVLNIGAFSATGQVAVESQKFQINGIGTITLPAAMELQSAEWNSKVDSIKREIGPSLAIPLPQDKAVFQQAGLNDKVAESFSTYARVMISVTMGAPGDFGRSVDVRLASSEEIKQLNALYKAEIENQANSGVMGLKLIAWHGVDRAEINGWTAIHYSYTRSIQNGLPTLVNVYRFHNDDRIFTVTLSYRLQDEARWKPVMNSIIHSFVITNIR